MPARDQRTVGELLADSDSLSRHTLLDVTPCQGPAMVRAWGHVVQSAAQLWAVLPPVSVAAPSGPDLMVRLRGFGEGIARSTAGHWPGPGRQDQRLLEIGRNLSRARDLVERYGRDVRPTGAEVRTDIAAARARVIHTLYVGAHGTAGALRDYANDLRDRVRADTRRRRPVGLRPEAREIQAAEAMLSRSEVFEQLVAGHVGAHPVTASVLGEVHPIPPPSRLQSALTAWDIQAHRTLATNPDAADLVRIGRVQALIASAAAVVTGAAGEKTEVDPDMVERITGTLDASQVAWSRLAKRWVELTSQDGRADPALSRAASEVRAAISATACIPTGWATPDQIAGRVDLKRAQKSLQLSMVGALDVAHIAREVAATHPTLTAPARVIAMRAQGEAEIAREQGIAAFDGKTWASPRQIVGNQVIPLPEPARRGLVNLTNNVIASCNRTAATASLLDPSDCAATKDASRRRAQSTRGERQEDPWRRSVYARTTTMNLGHRPAGCHVPLGAGRRRLRPRAQGCGTRGA